VGGVDSQDTRKVLLIGAGGHARVCLEALHDDPRNTVVGAVSRDGTAVERLGIPVLGTDDDLLDVTEREGVDAACVVIGDNATRARLTARWLATGRPLISALSRFAMVSTTATVGDGCMLLPGAIVNAATTLGTGVIVNTNSSVDHDGTIGDFVHVAPGVAIGGGVTIGSGTLVGIGARVLPQVTIGRDVVVGGGAVVADDLPDSVVVTGIPARPRRRLRS
jgi:UDP-perosamine 4-acetyltransferase